MKKLMLVALCVLAMGCAAGNGQGIGNPPDKDNVKVDRFNGWEILPGYTSRLKEYEVSLHCEQGSGMYQTYQKDMGLVVIPNDPLCKR